MAVANNKLIAKNTVVLAVQQTFSLFVSLYTSRIILQSLGVSDFGIYNVVAGFVSMFAFLNTSMTNATQRFYNFEYGKNGNDGALKVFNNALVIHIILAVIVISLLESIGVWYILNRLVVPEDKLDSAFWVFQISSISLMFVILQIPFSAAITAHEKMLVFAFVNILDSLLKLAVAIIVNHYYGERIIFYSLLIGIITVVDFLIYFIYSKSKIKEVRLQPCLDSVLLKEMLSFSGWNLFGSFSSVAKEQGLNLILNSFFGTVVNASRGIAYQVASAARSFTFTVTISGRPQLVQSYAQCNYNRTIQLMFSMSKFSYIIFLFFAVPLMIEIDYVLKLWLDTSIPSFTGIFVNLVILINLVESLNPPTSFVVHASGRMARYQTTSSLFMLLLLPASFIFLHLGASAESVFLLCIAFQILCQIICLLILKSIINYSLVLYAKEVVIPLLMVSIVSFTTSYIAKSFIYESFVRLIVVSIVSCIMIAILSYIYILNSKEKQLIKNIIKKYH